jgi:hypothetical protein
MKRRIAALAATVGLGLAAFMPAAAASNTYSIDYHGAQTTFEWVGTNNYVDYVIWTVKDVTSSRVCPSFNVTGPYFQQSGSGCANPGQTFTVRHNLYLYANIGTYAEHESMPGWPTITHTFGVS